MVCLPSRHARLPLPAPIRNISGHPTSSPLISGLLHLLGVGISTPFISASRRRRHDSSWHVRHTSHHRYGSDSWSLPACAGLSFLATSSRISSTHLLMIRVTTRIPTANALIIVPLQLLFLYTTLIVSLTAAICLVLVLLFVLIYCMAFRLEDTILALIRPPSCTIRLFVLPFVSFALSSYPWLQIAMVDRPTLCNIVVAGIETRAHGAAAFELSSSLHCVVSSIVSCCTRLDLFPCSRLVPNCSTSVTMFVGWVY